MRGFARVLSAVALWLVPVAAHGNNGDLSLEQQFELFLDWFPGRYDSALQTRTEALDDVPVEERNYRRHSIFRRVDLPAFGQTVFYAEQYRDGDPDRIYRQRIYVFTLDTSRSAFRLRVHVPHDPAPLRGAYRDPSLLAGLKPADTRVWQGCDLTWRWLGDRFRGSLDPGACRFTSEAFGQDIVLEEYLELGPDYIRFADRGLSLDGEYLFGMRGKVPNESLKVRPFLCELRGDAPTAAHWLHDQGGRIALPGGRALAMQRWNGTDEESGLRLDLLNGEDIPLAAAIAPRDAETIGLEAAGAAARCRHVPDAVYTDGRE